MTENSAENATSGISFNLNKFFDQIRGLSPFDTEKRRKLKKIAAFYDMTSMSPTVYNDDKLMRKRMYEEYFEDIGEDGVNENLTEFFKCIQSVLETIDDLQLVPISEDEKQFFEEEQLNYMVLIEENFVPHLTFRKSNEILVEKNGNLFDLKYESQHSEEEEKDETVHNNNTFNINLNPLAIIMTLITIENKCYHKLPRYIFPHINLGMSIIVKKLKINDSIAAEKINQIKNDEIIYLNLEDKSPFNDFLVKETVVNNYKNDKNVFAELKDVKLRKNDPQLADLNSDLSSVSSRKTISTNNGINTSDFYQNRVLIKNRDSLFERCLNLGEFIDNKTKKMSMNGEVFDEYNRYMHQRVFGIKAQSKNHKEKQIYDYGNYITDWKYNRELLKMNTKKLFKIFEYQNINCVISKNQVCYFHNGKFKGVFKNGNILKGYAYGNSDFEFVVNRFLEHYFLTNYNEKIIISQKEIIFEKTRPSIRDSILIGCAYLRENLCLGRLKNVLPNKRKTNLKKDLLRTWYQICNTLPTSPDLKIETEIKNIKSKKITTYKEFDVSALPKITKNSQILRQKSLGLTRFNDSELCNSMKRDILLQKNRKIKANKKEKKCKSEEKRIILKRRDTSMKDSKMEIFKIKEEDWNEVNNKLKGNCSEKRVSFLNSEVVQRDINIYDLLKFQNLPRISNTRAYNEVKRKLNCIEKKNQILSFANHHTLKNPFFFSNTKLSLNVEEHFDIKEMWKPTKSHEVRKKRKNKTFEKYSHQQSKEFQKKVMRKEKEQELKIKREIELSKMNKCKLSDKIDLDFNAPCSLNKYSEIEKNNLYVTLFIAGIVGEPIDYHNILNSLCAKNTVKIKLKNKKVKMSNKRLRNYLSNFL